MIMNAYLPNYKKNRNSASVSVHWELFQEPAWNLWQVHRSAARTKTFREFLKWRRRFQFCPDNIHNYCCILNMVNLDVLSFLAHEKIVINKKLYLWSSTQLFFLKNGLFQFVSLTFLPDLLVLTFFKKWIMSICFTDISSRPSSFKFNRFSYSCYPGTDHHSLDILFEKDRCQWNRIYQKSEIPKGKGSERVETSTMPLAESTSQNFRYCGQDSSSFSYAGFKYLSKAQPFFLIYEFGIKFFKISCKQRFQIF